MIKSKAIDEYIHNILLKPHSEDLSEEDLKLVKGLIINKYNIKNEEVIYDYSDLKELINLEKCSIEFLEITDELIQNINTLNNLKIFELGHTPSKSSSEKIYNSLSRIIMNNVNSEMLDLFENCSNVESVKLIEIKDIIDIEKIIKFKNLKYLYIYNSKVINSEFLKQFEKLQVLKLDGTKLDNDDILKEISPDVKIQKKEVFLYES